jgi:hypothetical protein
MCQVAGYTNPCCRRTYVFVSRTPGCPEDWPKSKCPPEYCLQIRQYEAEERSTGVCWRCEAKLAGEDGAAREYRRPKIDTAFWAPPLQLRVDQRKKHVENQGRCWYCNAVGGCNGCGSKQIPIKEIPTLNRQPDVCWHCNAHKYCQMCRVRDILKDEDSLSLGFNHRYKRSQSAVTGGSQGHSNTKKVKIERPDSKASVRSSLPTGPHHNYHRANAMPHAYSHTAHLYNSPLPSTEFTLGSPSNMSSNAGYQSQGFYPDIPSMGSHGWHPVNQETHVVNGMNSYDQATDYQSDTGSVNGQYTSFKHNNFNQSDFDQQAQSIQQYPGAGPGFPSSNHTPMNVVSGQPPLLY